MGDICGKVRWPERAAVNPASGTWRGEPGNAKWFATRVHEGAAIVLDYIDNENARDAAIENPDQRGRMRLHRRSYR